MAVGQREDAVARDGDADGRIGQNGLTFQALAFAVADIARGEHEIVASLAGETCGRNQQGHLAPAARAEGHLPVDHAAVVLHRSHKTLALFFARPDVQLQRGAAHRFSGAPAGVQLKTAVDHRVAPAGQIRQRDEVGAGGHQVRKQGLGTAHRLVGGQPFGVVDDDGQECRAADGVHTHAGAAYLHGPAVHTQAEARNRQRTARSPLLQLRHAAHGAVARVANFKVLQHVGAHHLRQVLVAEQLHRRRVGVQHPSVTVQHQRRGNAREEFLVARFCGGQGFFGSAHGSDIAHHAPVAVEDTVRVEARLTADQQRVAAPSNIEPAHGHVAEGAAVVHVGLQAVQHLVVALELRQLPHAVPAALLGCQRTRRVRANGGGAEAVAAVGFPISVSGQSQQAAETAFAFVGTVGKFAQQPRGHHAAGQAGSHGHQQRAQHHARAGQPRCHRHRGHKQRHAGNHPGCHHGQQHTGAPAHRNAQHADQQAQQRQ